MYRNVSESNITYQSPLPQLTTTQSMYGISSSHSPSQRANATPPISMHTPPISVGYGRIQILSLAQNYEFLLILR